MEQIREFVDERQKSCCVHCGSWLAGCEANRDHVPSKALLRKPYPANLPCVEICRSCNEGFSFDEAYLMAFVSCVLAGSADPDQQNNPKAQRLLRNDEKLRARIEASRRDNGSPDGEPGVFWVPERKRVNRIIVKNARGHALHEYGEPMLDEPDRVWCAPLSTLTAEQRLAFESIDIGTGWPEVGSRMLTRVVTGQDLSGDWVIVQDGVYRYAVAQQGLMLVRTVLSEYLATEVSWTD